MDVHHDVIRFRKLNRPGFAGGSNS
jgi:hypothetical protein